MTKALLKSIKLKKRIYKQFCKATDPHEKTKIQKRFKVCRNHLVKLSRKTTTRNILKTTEKMRSEIRSIINIKHKKFPNISLTIDGTTVTDSNTLANHFNTFFTSIANKLLQKTSKTNKRFNDFLNFHNESSFYISPTDQCRI